VSAALKQRLGKVACDLLGPPNRDLSTPAQLRFGAHGSIAVEIAGPKAGVWFDHETGVGGSAIELVRHVRKIQLLDALDWARDWLGWPPFGPDFGAFAPGAEPPPQDGGLDSRSAEPRPDTWSEAHHGPLPDADPDIDSNAGTASDEERARKVDALIADAIDPAGTPADLYLRNRAITARPLPACVRYLPATQVSHGAMLVVATDDRDGVHAVQRTYLTDTGLKAPVKVQKRTNKAHDGWSVVSTVRMPGAEPLVLCEGVETALSVWQATGVETWACLGVSNIGRAPVPPAARVIIARDGDTPGSKADHQIRNAVAALKSRGYGVVVVEPPIGSDFNDLLRQHGEQEIRDRFAAAMRGGGADADWRAQLLVNAEGYVRPVLANAIHALREAPAWEGVLWHNAFATETVARRPPPWLCSQNHWTDTSWSDRDDALVADWLQHQGIMVSAAIAGEAVEVVARDHSFHPVVEYLETLTWDGISRLNGWLCRYLGAADTAYHCAVGPRWMIAAVARIFDPGCKADSVLILEGAQGIRKSSALSVLGGSWFADRLSDLGSKDAAMETRGVWIIEIAELDSMSRSEVGTTKAFISRTSDRFRPPYGKRLVNLPRQCVFAGTVNPEGGYLKDATGARRFWPVACGSIDLVGLQRDRDQLWAEAGVLYRQGHPWWLETQELEALATEQQAERYQGDAWDDMIEVYLEHDISWAENGFGEARAIRHPRSRPLVDVSVGEILQKALNIPEGRWNQADQNRVARGLVSMGFEQYRPRGDGQKRSRRYRLRTAGGGAG
jgi:predicted P-loop ATPase